MSDNKNIIGNITEGFATSTSAAHEISKNNMAKVKAGTKAYHDEVTAPHPGMAEVKEAEGLGGKAKAVFKGMADECEQQKEITMQYQDDAINLRGTSEVLNAIEGFTGSIIKASVPGRR